MNLFYTQVCTEKSLISDIPYSGLFSRGKIFANFIKSSSIRENFTLEMLQSVAIHEKFALEKLRRLNSPKFSPSKIAGYTV